MAERLKHKSKIHNSEKLNQRVRFMLGPSDVLSGTEKNTVSEPT